MKWKRSKKGYQESKSKSQGSSKSKITEDIIERSPEGVLKKIQTSTQLENIEPQFSQRIFLSNNNFNEKNNPYILGIA
ncbi:CLUMA_CG009516, isoform A [Clunio marinus]|nr:CLUMA_CG009516, isoform A [Clunio marinus]